MMAKSIVMQPHHEPVDRRKEAVRKAAKYLRATGGPLLLCYTSYYTALKV
jgi:hypothetical protein